MSAVKSLRRPDSRVMPLVIASLRMDRFHEYGLVVAGSGSARDIFWALDIVGNPYGYAFRPARHGDYRTAVRSQDRGRLETDGDETEEVRRPQWYVIDPESGGTDPRILKHTLREFPWGQVQE